MRICVDFDGVLAATWIAKVEWLRENLGIAINVPHLVNRSALVPQIGADAYVKMQSEVGFEGTLCARPEPAAIETIRRLSASHEIVVMSARARDKMSWVDRWLTLYQINTRISGVVCTDGHLKGPFVALCGGDLLLDDDARHVDSCFGFADGVLYRPDADQLARGRRGVDSWQEFEALILDRTDSASCSG